MKTSDLVRYYSQQGFRDFMVSFCANREVIPRFREFLGERPQSFRYDSDLLNVIRKGVTSFHFSQEKWANPMGLSSESSKAVLDDLRIGWDLVFDVDTKCFDYAKLCAKFVMDTLDYLDVKNIDIKYSGGNGFHIGVAISSPESVKGMPVRLLFPDAARIVGLYIEWVIRDYLRDALLSVDSIDRIAERVGLSKDELIVDGVFNPFKVVSIDPIAISSRHLMRAPYSLNEKKWLVSVPIDRSHVMDFSPDEAVPERVTFERGFLNRPCDVSQLLTKAFDWFGREEAKKKSLVRVNHEVPHSAVSPNCFPPCINYILAGIPDGRKRGLFTLVNFYAKCAYSFDVIEGLVREWNNSNKPPLKEGYVKGQLDWARKTGALMPPNCSSPNYKDIGACHPDLLCRKIKNPVTYALHKSKLVSKPVRGQKSFNAKKAKELKKINEAKNKSDEAKKVSPDVKVNV